jgi:chromosome segregation ATPase
MTEPVFLVALAIAGSTVVMVAKTIAGAIRGRASPRSEIAHLSDQLEQHAAALEDTQNTLAHQSAQLTELQERLDFAERLLVRGPDRPAE